jgi:hypothetical protein
LHAERAGARIFEASPIKSLDFTPGRPRRQPAGFYPAQIWTSW